MWKRVQLQRLKPSSGLSIGTRRARRLGVWEVLEHQAGEREGLLLCGAKQVAGAVKVVVVEAPDEDAGQAQVHGVVELAVPAGGTVHVDAVPTVWRNVVQRQTKQPVVRMAGHLHFDDQWLQSCVISAAKTGLTKSADVKRQLSWNVYFYKNWIIQYIFLTQMIKCVSNASVRTQYGIFAFSLIILLPHTSCNLIWCPWN